MMLKISMNFKKGKYIRHIFNMIIAIKQKIIKITIIRGKQKEKSSKKSRSVHNLQGLMKNI